MQRDRTGLFNSQSQTKRASAIRTLFNTDYSNELIDYIPIVNLFFESEHTYDATTYDFELNGSGMFRIAADEAPSSKYGYYTSNLSESTSQQFIIWKEKTLLAYLSELGGRTIAIVGAIAWLISGY